MRRQDKGHQTFATNTKDVVVTAGTPKKHSHMLCKDSLALMTSEGKPYEDLNILNNFDFSSVNDQINTRGNILYLMVG